MKTNRIHVTLWLSRITLSLVFFGASIGNSHADLMITLGDPPSVQRFDETTGFFLGDFVTPGSGGIDLPQKLTYGPDGNLYVVSSGSLNILRYDGKTGAFIDVFIPTGRGGLGRPYGLTFGPDGNLYLTGGAAGILRYNGITGEFIDLFIDIKNYGTFSNLSFGPDGNLYVTTTNFGMAVLRFDGKNGQPYPAPGQSGAFFAPAGDVVALTFGPNGDLFVPDQCRNVKRYNGSTGAFIGTFITDVPIQGNGQCIQELAFGPNGNLYVGGYYSTVFQYNGKTGAFINSFGSGQRGTLGLTFTPFPTSKDQCKNDNWRSFGFKNQGQCIQYVKSSCRKK